jgi:IS5 family transposase
MRYPKRSQYKYAKSPYRILNWPEHEVGLRNRGGLTLWLSDAALHAWRAPPSGTPGGQRTYSDLAIEAALTIRMVFHLPLRQTEGFLRSLADLLGLEPPIPDHTPLSRRLKRLENLRIRRLVTEEPIHLLIDSTGLSIHVGHLRKPPKRRGWRKLHLAVDADTGEVLASDLTNRRTADCARVHELLDQIEGQVVSVTADGAYDAGSVYEAARKKGDGHRVRVLIPPIKGAQPSSSRSPGQWKRNRNIRSVRKLGRREWFASSGYGRRSLVENAVFRYKAILGQRMRSRSLPNQRVEVQLASKILNTMTSLGRPDSYRVP